MLSDATLAYGEQITTALLGVDALYRAESDDQDGLVVLNMSTSHQPEPFGAYEAARDRFTELAARSFNLPEADRRLYYRQVCDSTLAFIQWRCAGLPFTEQLAGFLHVPAEPAADATLDALRAEMRGLLNRMGYDGDLAQQCAAWEARVRVHRDALQETLDALLDEAWDRTERLLRLPDPKSDGMRVSLLSGAHFNARCDYLGRRMEINSDPVLTRPSLKHLVAHEAYPGHYVQFKLRETWYSAGTAAADGLLSVVNTASSCTFEGIADNGLTLLDWIEDDDDRLSAVIGRYRTAIGTVAGWQLHAEGVPAPEVADWLRRHALVGGEGWVANRMAFLTAPARAVLIWSYFWGAPSVTPVWQRQPPKQQEEFLRFLYGRLHSPQSVALFAPAVQ